MFWDRRGWWRGDGGRGGTQFGRPSTRGAAAADEAAGAPLLVLVLWVVVVLVLWVVVVVVVSE